ncbi:hypothetical protein N7493_011082 [Penicillium malachiteum]|uniref:DUF7600 domain-containing protein n=1 Tax=Penicillium malachiteum TaxID=1324776 RepID=A0AAD6HBP7_9EURO|nr:hypothetical protein N7493_011082 [Penicillium malachiteum]
MSPRTDCCVICGYDIRDHGTLEGKWLMEFRAIYSNPEGCFISGVGINTNTDDPLQAPSDPTKRYDDENYDPHLIKNFFVKFCWEETIALVSHDACWKLFEEALKPNNIPLKRLIEICSSLPLINLMGVFHWGHTYGGIYTFDHTSTFPWEYRLVEEPSDTEALQCATVNPYDIPTLRGLIAETAHKQPLDGTALVNETSDCFGRLSWEILEAIANQLSTRDALSLRMIEANGKLMELVRSEFGDYNVLNDGCRLLKTQHAHIPHNLDSISLSFIGVGDHGHLTGICLNSKDGIQTQLGYRFPKGTMVYKVEDLSGLVLAIDPKGVRAVKIVHRDEHCSDWFGFPEMTPVTERLRVVDATKPMHVSVDGYKIIGIAAHGPENVSDHSRLADTSPSLRSTALWYPAVPDKHISLNEQNLQETSTLTTKYMPLQWGYFGGPQGAYLQYLTGVSLSYFVNPLSIDFHYAVGSHIHRTQLGKVGDPETDDTPLRPIDGPEGEIIQSVQVAMCRGGICALKLKTNNGTTFQCGTTSPPRPRAPFPGAPIPEREPEAEFETLTVAPNTTITGFYAPYVSTPTSCFSLNMCTDIPWKIYSQLSSLGITSEATDR